MSGDILFRTDPPPGFWERRLPPSCRCVSVQRGSHLSADPAWFDPKQEDLVHFEVTEHWQFINLSFGDRTALVLVRRGLLNIVVDVCVMTMYIT